MWLIGPNCKKCHICKKKCTGDIFKTETDKFVHIACFKCKKCSRPLSETGFFTAPDDSFLCPDDYRSIASPLNVQAEQPTVERHEELPSPPLASPTACAACDQPLHSGQVLLALDQSWHVWCFKCAECDVVLQGEYMTHEGKPLCLRDYNLKHGVKCYECEKFIAGKVLQNNAPESTSFIRPAPVAVGAETTSAMGLRCTCRATKYGIRTANILASPKIWRTHTIRFYYVYP
ncbi:hypothetical protein L596_003640 [Steinernema carpocapsae]|uniref:LIM zinc-binding domain-containing protein n=1 Tax=Steinernema carpocapsae TaxID=34508 RepID=A0A4U8UT33_STECR|nr:hypothetical protein L596_003640 [Steinernema carpocapsae]